MTFTVLPVRITRLQPLRCVRLRSLNAHVLPGGVTVPDNSTVESTRLKVREQIEKTEHLIRLIPPDRIEWNPQWPCGSSDVGHLLGHLLECLAGFCAVFHAAFPHQLKGVLELRSLPVNHF